MNFLSVNVKRLGADGKVNWVKDLKNKNEVSFLALQETQLSKVESVNIDRLWGCNGFAFDIVEAEGRSGGLVNVWDEKVFSKKESILDQNFLITAGFLVSDHSALNIVNVYGPQSVTQKRRLWGQLATIMGRLNGLWILLGDFNVVRFPEERKNSGFNPVSVHDFNEFISEMGLTKYVTPGKL